MYCKVSTIVLIQGSQNKASRVGLGVASPIFGRKEFHFQHFTLDERPKLRPWQWICDGFGLARSHERDLKVQPLGDETQYRSQRGGTGNDTVRMLHSGLPDLQVGNALLCFRSQTYDGLCYIVTQTETTRRHSRQGPAALRKLEVSVFCSISKRFWNFFTPLASSFFCICMASLELILFRKSRKKDPNFRDFYPSKSSQKARSGTKV